MKILVDELPKNSTECLMSTCTFGAFNIIKCKIANDPSFVCKMGTEGFTCPYLRKFEARAHKYTYGDGNSITGEISIPVELK